MEQIHSCVSFHSSRYKEILSRGLQIVHHLPVLNGIGPASSSTLPASATPSSFRSHFNLIGRQIKALYLSISAKAIQRVIVLRETREGE